MRHQFMRVGGQEPNTPVNTTGYQSETIDYLDRVFAVDNRYIEQNTANAIDAFVAGCKTDGTWSAIKASCILAAARTLNGALVPLVGSAPTNFNFTSSDYNRKTGLKGDKSTKYLNANRNNNADPQNSRHLSVYATEVGSADSFIASIYTGNGYSMLYHDIIGGNYFNPALSSTFVSMQPYNVPMSAGFVGATRSSSSQMNGRYSRINFSGGSTTSTPLNSPLYIFAFNGSPYTNARLSFYSIGENINLTLLNNRLDALMTAFNTSIP